MVGGENSHRPIIGFVLCTYEVFSTVIRRQLEDAMALSWGTLGILRCQQPS